MEELNVAGGYLPVDNFQAVFSVITGQPNAKINQGLIKFVKHMLANYLPSKEELWLIQKGVMITEFSDHLGDHETIIVNEAGLIFLAKLVRDNPIEFWEANRKQ
jgi:hypothetical protein